MEWVQIYDPLDCVIGSSAVAGLPIIVLLGLLLAGVSAPRAAAIGLTIALLVSTCVFGMPVSSAVAAAGYGVCFGLLPIGWIIVPAVFLFQLSVHSGQFEILKRAVAAISPDRRMQALLIAFCFGTLLEGAAGFGAPVAICSALLIGIGFSPLYAAALSLLANTSPVAFGSLGIPIHTLAEVSGMNSMALCQMAGRQLTFFSLIIPAWIVGIMSGWKGIKGCWPVLILCGGSYATIQFLMANYHGPALVCIAAGAGSLCNMVLFLRFWQPREIWLFPDEISNDKDNTPAVEGNRSTSDTLPRPSFSSSSAVSTRHDLSAGRLIYAWMPWLLLAGMVSLWSWPAWQTMLNGGTPENPNVLRGIGKLSISVPWLDGRVYRTSPVAPVALGSDRATSPEKAIYTVNWLSATGTGLFFATILAGFWLRVGFFEFFMLFGKTVYSVRWALMTIACMLALAFTTKYSGADATLGLAFTHTGWFYPFFAPMLGWLGVALTGSDTSCNALFGSLQRITAGQLHLNPVLIVTANSTGGVMGKMIDAQSIVVAAAATQQSGNEGRILRFVFFHSIILAVFVGLLTLAQAYLMPWMIPATR
jgi:lactate permease